MSTRFDTFGFDRFDRFVPDRVVLLWGALLVLFELLAVLLFVSQPAITPTDPLIYAYPFVWINVGLWGAAVVSPPDAEPHQRRGARLLVVAYLLVLAYAAGILGPGGVPTGVEGPTTVRLETVPPGWGPIVALYGPGFDLQLMPYQVVGYAALGYLVYAALLDVATSVAGGALGLLTCVSCSWPVLASLLTGVVGSTAALSAAVYARPYGLATIAYVLTIVVLVWRPRVGGADDTG